MNRSSLTHKAGLLAALAIAGFSGAAVAEDASALQNNPFRRPVFSTAASPAPVQDSLSDVSGLELRAILVAGRDSLVNVAGTIVRIGQEHEGYRLVSVDEEEVVFRKDGDDVTVKLHQEEENDEQD